MQVEDDIMESLSDKQTFDEALYKEHIKDAYYRVSVKAKIKQGNKIVLVREDGKKWDLPGGGVEHSETIDDGLKRELKEEIGLEQFETNISPKLFKMIDMTANRPLLFIVFEFEIDNSIKLCSSANTEIGLFDVDNIPDVVDYSPEYTSYIKNQADE